MRRKMSIAGALGAVVLLAGGLVAVVAAPASAAAVAAENQDGVSRSPSGNYNNYCRDATAYGVYADVCFQPYGDLLFVLDTKADGRSAYIYWENWQYDSYNNEVLVRYGRCYNRLGSANGWAACDKDFVENSTHPNDAGGVGSWLVYSPCEVDVGCGASRTQYNNE